MSELTTNQLLNQCKWLTPQDLDEIRLDGIIEEKLRESRKTTKRKRNLPTELKRLKHDNS